ncbi:MAG: undecaprenyl/decaprenyl-phosphate alpha-N-acetylglucosaminyl 1-phosphate transferase [bacterium]|nr:undecaprenyl/decaprenyl-phosphate alpha-N-acetylglucosaminyl 1-phosphate transferase [bacterium]
MAWYHFFLLFFEGFLLSLVLTRVMRSIAPRLGYLDQPGHRKVHHNPKPLLGGAAIYLSFIICVLGDLAVLYWIFTARPDLPGGLGEHLEQLALYAAGIQRVWDQLAGLLAGSTMLFVLGLIDDRFGMSPYIKLGGQIFATLILYVVGIRIALFIDYPIVNFALTLSWIVLISNSFNLLDNMDGLSGGVAMIALLLLGLATHMVSNQAFMSSMSFVLAGCIAGFLRYNLNPSTIFMGDAGSLILGYLVSALTIQSTFYQTGTENATAWSVVMPFVILAVPIFDTLSVIFIRLKNGKPIFEGDKNHFSHRLVALGMSHRRAVFFIHLLTLSVGSSALILPLMRKPFGAYVVFSQTIIIFILIAMLEAISIQNRKD